jgi:hypothetical protein
MSDNETETHESYGMVGFSRVTSSNGTNFFGSSIRSSHYIELTIRRAERARNLNQYWYRGTEELINIRLSPNQFADLLTSLNIGHGVPCTIQHVNCVRMAECPSVDQRAKYEEEFKRDVREVVAAAKQLASDVQELFKKPTINKGDRAPILEKLRMLMQEIESNMPFVQTQFNEAMDKTVTEAKGEVEAFVNHKIHSLGINALNTEILAALEAPLNSEPLQLAATTEGEIKL